MFLPLSTRKWLMFETSQLLTDIKLSSSKRNVAQSKDTKFAALNWAVTDTCIPTWSFPTIYALTGSHLLSGVSGSAPYLRVVLSGSAPYLRVVLHVHALELPTVGTIHSTTRSGVLRTYSGDWFRCYRKICRPEIVSRRQFFLMSLTINVATVYPKKILSLRNTVARMLCHSHMRWHDQTEYGVAFCYNRIYPPLYNKNERDCLRRRAKSFVVKEGVLFYRDNEGGDFQVI